jgi:hypothetical protein
VGARPGGRAGPRPAEARFSDGSRRTRARGGRAAGVLLAGLLALAGCGDGDGGAPVPIADDRGAAARTDDGSGAPSDPTSEAASTGGRGGRAETHAPASAQGDVAGAALDGPGSAETHAPASAQGDDGPVASAALDGPGSAETHAPASAQGDDGPVAGAALDGPGSAETHAPASAQGDDGPVAGAAVDGPGSAETHAPASGQGDDAPVAGGGGDGPAAAAGPHEGAPSGRTREATPQGAATGAGATAETARAGAGADRFLRWPDAPIRSALRREAIAEVERGGGGRSLGFRITFADGTRAYFKPDQAFNGTSWYAELVAYHLDRALGLGRVAPVVGRRFEWRALAEAAGDDERIEEIAVDEDGRVVGALIWWVPERLVPVALPRGWQRWLRIDDERPEVNPFQRPGSYRAARAAAREARREREAAGEREATPQPETPAEPPRPDTPQRPAELSDLIVFDYLVHNADRWGTRNTNVRCVGEGGPLMYLDNAAAFTLRRPRVGIMDTRLAQVQRFRRATIDAIRALDLEAFARRLEHDELGPLLDEHQLEALATRRAHLLRYVDRLVERFGEAAVYPW